MFALVCIANHNLNCINSAFFASSHCFECDSFSFQCELWYLHRSHTQLSRVIWTSASGINHCVDRINQFSSACLKTNHYGPVPFVKWLLARCGPHRPSVVHIFKWHTLLIYHICHSCCVVKWPLSCRLLSVHLHSVVQSTGPPRRSNINFLQI